MATLVGQMGSEGTPGDSHGQISTALFAFASNFEQFVSG